MGFDLYGNSKIPKANTFATMFGGGDDLQIMFASTLELLMRKTKNNGSTMMDTQLAKRKLNRLLTNLNI